MDNPGYRLHRSNSRVVGSAKVAQRDLDQSFEHFVVVGAGPDQEKPEILFHYPTDVNLAYGDELLAFCLPFGLEQSRVRRSGSMTQVHELMFGHLSDMETSQRSFVFMLNTGTRILYGVCVLSEELTHTLPSFIKPFRPAFDDDSYESSTRCYCFLSSYPFFEAHFDVLYAILANERLYNFQRMDKEENMRQKSRKSLLQQVHGKKHGISPAAKFRHLKSDSFDGSSGDDDEPDVKIMTNEPEVAVMSMCERQVDCPSLSLVREYLNLDLPSRDKSVTVSLASDPVPCRIELPSGTEQDLLGRWGLPCLTRMLSLSDFLSLYTALLLEVPVVIVSRNPGTLSAIALSAIALISPLVWQGPLIPVLPQTLQECLDSPVPLIAGLPELPADTSGWNDPLVLNMNERTVTLPAKKMELLPDKRKLVTELKVAYGVMRPTASSSNLTTLKSSGSSSDVFRRCDEEETAAVFTILNAIRTYSYGLVCGKAVDSALRAEAECENREVTLEAVVKMSSRSHQPFMRQLVATQQFYVHAGKRKAHLTREESAREETVRQLDRRIAEAKRRGAKLQAMIDSYTEQLTAVTVEVQLLESSRAKLQVGCLKGKPKAGKMKGSRGHKRTKSWLG